MKFVPIYRSHLVNHIRNVPKNKITYYVSHIDAQKLTKKNTNFVSADDISFNLYSRNLSKIFDIL